MKKSLDEWILKYPAAQYFYDQAQCHINVIGGDMSEQDRRRLLRLISISFRQAALDFGVEE